MNIFINGEQRSVEQNNLSALVAELVDARQPAAIALNEQFVPKALYSETTLTDGDRIEILSPMQGG